MSPLQTHDKLLFCSLLASTVDGEKKSREKVVLYCRSRGMIPWTSAPPCLGWRRLASTTFSETARVLQMPSYVLLPISYFVRALPPELPVPYFQRSKKTLLMKLCYNRRWRSCSNKTVHKSQRINPPFGVSPISQVQRKSRTSNNTKKSSKHYTHRPRNRNSTLA